MVNAMTALAYPQIRINYSMAMMCSMVMFARSWDRAASTSGEG